MLLVVDVPSYTGRAVRTTGQARAAVSQVMAKLAAAAQLVRPEVFVGAFNCSPRWDRRTAGERHESDPAMSQVLTTLFSALDRSPPKPSKYSTVLVKDEWQAEDILATLAAHPDRLGVPRGSRVVLMSRNARVTQCLVAGRVVVLRDVGGKQPEWVRYDEPDVPVPPELTADYLALVGCGRWSGVKGIGPAKAEELLGRYGSIDGILASDDSEHARAKELIRETVKQGVLDRQLAAMRLNSGLRLDPTGSHEQWRTVIVGDGRDARLECVCSQCELRGRRRLYGYLGVLDNAAEVAGLAYEAIKRKGYYDPHETQQ